MDSGFPFGFPFRAGLKAHTHTCESRRGDGEGSDFPCSMGMCVLFSGYPWISLDCLQRKPKQSHFRRTLVELQKPNPKRAILVGGLFIVA